MPTKISTVLFSLSLLAFVSNVQAAPQILGLVATHQPVPLTCEDGMCSAEITTVCLQEHRKVPMPGRVYKASANSAITLSIEGKLGKSKAVSITQKVTFKASRHYTSVLVNLPESYVSSFGKGKPSIAIGALSSAIPVPLAGDKSPLTAFEIEQYTGPLRDVAGNIFQEEKVRVALTGHLNQVINRLPGGLANDQALFEKQWSNVKKQQKDRLTPEVMAPADEIANICREDYRVGKYATMRSCLEQHHDIHASETNKRIWDALKPGG